MKRHLLLLAGLALAVPPAWSQEPSAPFYTIAEARVLDGPPTPEGLSLGTPLPAPAEGQRFVALRLGSQEAFNVLVGDFVLHAPDEAAYPAIGAGPFELQFVSDVRQMEAPAMEMSGASDIWLVFEVPTPMTPLTTYRLVLGATAPVPLPEPLP